MKTGLYIGSLHRPTMLSDRDLDSSIKSALSRSFYLRSPYERWMLLMTLLSFFGVPTDGKSLYLDWDEAKVDYVQRLVSFLESLVNGRIHARFERNDRSWIFSLV